ncbi:DUF222 domain-containing protein [Aeromicrobium sp. S22]|uniref:DUF222 domain-containing protein n=1 Tax=Aeromicrobium sp. S22 TaxID=2662029 RepID=UPI00129D6173|nr:DUF222 domain-containing protein [Aeromicrobium sp. S22]MRK00780.1 DUF222 domain-containing protein [Aeromicrobium sp. S22]
MLDDHQMIDQIVIRREAMASLDAAEAADLVDYVDRARGPRRADAAVHELSLALTQPVPTIERRIAQARRLRSTMPTVWQAWQDGRLSTSAVGEIDRAARRLTHPTSRVDLDGQAVDAASGRTPGQLSRWLDRWVERTEAHAARARHETARADRAVRLRPLGDAMTRLTVDIPATEAAAIAQRLTAAAHALASDDARTLDQARADIVCDVLLDRRDGALGYRAVIGITVPLSSLLGFSDAPGELTDRSATIPAFIVREAVADEHSLLYRLVTDDIGNLLTVQWLGRFAPARLRQVLAFRDGTSVFPTSSVPAAHCDSDHTDPWPAPTHAANTGPLNRRAHRLKTEGLIDLRQPTPGVFAWTTHTGHRYTRRPEPVPIADWDLPPPHPA